MKYRTLNSGEVVLEGDQYISTGSTIWSVAHVSSVGRTVAEWRGMGSWRRPVSQDNWIAFSERKPTKEDASMDGVVAWLDGTVALIQPWDRIPISSKYWMPLNFVPREPTRIKVDGHEVIPNKDGSIKVGCQTVASKDFEEIIRQRQEVMK